MQMISLFIERSYLYAVVLAIRQTVNFTGISDGCFNDLGFGDERRYFLD